MNSGIFIIAESVPESVDIQATTHTGPAGWVRGRKTRVKGYHLDTLHSSLYHRIERREGYMGSVCIMNDGVSAIRCEFYKKAGDMQVFRYRLLGQDEWYPMPLDCRVATIHIHPTTEPG